MLSNTVIVEAPYSANNESLKSANINFQSPDTSSILEKISMIQCTDDKPQLPIADSKVLETIVVTKDESEVHAQLEESVVVIIQTGVRGFLVFFLFVSFLKCLSLWLILNTNLTYAFIEIIQA